MAADDLTEDEIRERSAGKTAQGVILTVLGFMFAVPGAMLIIYGEHLLKKSEEDHGKSNVNVAIILGPILLLAGVVLLLAGLLTCSTLNCKRSEDQRPIYSVDSEANLQDNVSDCYNPYGQDHWQGSGLPSSGGEAPLGVPTANNLEVQLEAGEQAPTFQDNRMVLRLEPVV